MRTIRRLPGVVLLFIGVNLAAQPAVEEAQKHLRLANAAYERQDFAAYTAELEAALGKNPWSLATQHNLAGGYALTERPTESLRLLRRLLDVGADFGVADDTDLAALRSLTDYRALVESLAQRTQPNVRSEAHYASTRADLIPEGIAVDADTGRFFFGSMRNGDIYVLDSAMHVTKFASVDPANALSAIGMTVDQKRGMLWVVGTSFDLAESFAADDPVQTGVFGFDLASGEPERHYNVGEMTFGLNDVALGPDGALYASGETLHTLDVERDALVPLETQPQLYGTNGVAAAPDGRTLFVSSYPVGIAAIDLRSRTAQFLDTPADVSLYGVDGLYWHDGDLIAVQNGIRPWRLVRIELSDDRQAAVAVRVLELANESVTATTGAIVDDRMYYIGTGPAPANAPSQIAPNVAPFLGTTLIRSLNLTP